MSQHRRNFQIDEIYDPPERFLRREDITDLADVLDGTDDDLELGLKQININPDEFTQKQLREIKRDLQKIGLRSNGGTWTRDD